jgi:hypothetical protein
MIKKYNEWNILLEADSSDDFIQAIKKVLEYNYLTSGLDYSFMSSAAQIKNGTFSIRLNAYTIFKQLLKEKNIKDEDFINHVNSDSDILKISYTFYKAGTVKLTGTSSNGVKFDPVNDIEKGVKWMISNYKTRLLHGIMYGSRGNKVYLNPQKFVIAKSKYKEANLKNFENLFSESAYKEMSYINEFKDSSPKLVYICLLAKLYNSKIEERDDDFVKRTVGNVESPIRDGRAYLYLKLNPKVYFYIEVFYSWKIKKGEIITAPEIEYHVWDSSTIRVNDINSMYQETIPERIVNSYKLIEKGEYDIDKLYGMYKHTLFSNKYGL